MITFSEYLNNNFLIEAKELTRPLAYLYHAGYGVTMKFKSDVVKQLENTTRNHISLKLWMYFV